MPFPRIPARALLAPALALLGACSPVLAPDAPPETRAPDAPSAYTYPSAVYRSHVEMGTPRDASAADDLVLSRRTYTVSHNCVKGRPNWVSWNLNKTHFGDAPRATSFTSDASLPAGCNRVTTSDYTNGGYDRGHMVRSEERTWSVDDNKQTFLMTNVVPQTHDLNAGPWLKFESYLQSQAQSGNKEIYVISGATGSKGTLLNAGEVLIPSHTYKIAVIMPYGQGLANVTSTSSVTVIAVDMPNVTGISARPWTDYKTTVDQLEFYSGYNFLDRLPDAVESYWEARMF